MPASSYYLKIILTYICYLLTCRHYTLESTRNCVDVLSVVMLRLERVAAVNYVHGLALSASTHGDRRRRATPRRSLEEDELPAGSRDLDDVIRVTICAGRLSITGHPRRRIFTGA